MPTTDWTAAIGTANSTVTDGTTTTTRNYQSVVGAESSLVSYYKLDETSGTTITDSKNGLNGTVGTALLNQPSLISNLGSSIKFSRNAAQQILIPAGATNPMNGLTSFSVELWYRRDAFDGVPGSEAIFDCLGNNTGLKIYVQYYAPTPASRTWGTVAQFGTGSSYNFPTIFGGGGVPEASFFQANHVVVTYDGSLSLVNAYVNGRQTLSNFSSAYSPVTSGTSLKIGSYFQGAIDEVAVYNTALTAGQVKSHYYAAGDFASTGDHPKRSPFAPARTVNQTNINTDDRINRFRDPQGTSTVNWNGYAGAGTRTFTSVADGPTGYSTAISLAAIPDTNYPAILLGQNDTGTGTVSPTSLAQYAIPVNPGGKLSASVWLKPSSSAGLLRFTFYYRRGDGTFLTTTLGSVSVAAQTNTWQQLSETATVPAGAEWAYAHVYWTAGSGTAVELRATGWIAVPEATIPTFFDGSSTGARWSGSTNNSFSLITNSTRSIPKTRAITASHGATDELVNRSNNPSFEYSTPLPTYNSGTATPLGTTTLSYTTADSYAGSSSFEVSASPTLVATVPLAANPPNQLILSGLIDNSGAASFNGNRNVFVSAAVKLVGVTNPGTNPGITFQLGLRCYLTTNTSASIAPVSIADIKTTAQTTPIYQSDGWVIVSGVIQTHPATEKVSPRFFSTLINGTTTSTYTFRMDQIALIPLGNTPDSTTSTYFDGSYPNARWSGGSQSATALSGLSIAKMSGSYNRNISPNDPMKASDISSISQTLNRNFQDTYYAINPSPSIIDQATRFLDFNKILPLEDFAKTLDGINQGNSVLRFSRSPFPYDPAITNDETIRPAISQKLNRLIFNSLDFPKASDIAKNFVQFNRPLNDRLILIDSVIKSYGQNRRTADLITITDFIAIQWFAYLKSFGYIFENQNHIRTMFPSQNLDITPVPNTETEFYITTPQLGIADFSSNDY